MNLVLVQLAVLAYVGNKERRMQPRSGGSSSNAPRRFGCAAAGSGTVLVVKGRYAWADHAVNMSDVDVFAAAVAVDVDGFAVVEFVAAVGGEQKQETVAGRQLVAVERIVGWGMLPQLYEPTESGWFGWAGRRR